MAKKLEFVIAYLSNIISVRVKDNLLEGISLAERRQQSFDGIKAMIVGESQEKTVVLILEDIQWIDQTSEEFFSYVSSSLAKNRIMILALHRLEYICPWATSANYLRIPIQPLSGLEAEEMLISLTGVSNVEPDVKELVRSKTEGNPFFLEELIPELLEAGQIRSVDDVCRLVDREGKILVPATVQDVIMARIDRLEESMKRTLQRAAVIGREFTYSILEKIAEPDHELSPALQALQRSELITEKNLFPELEYMFKHALTQDVAYNSLLMVHRRELHSLVAAAIEELKRDVLEEHLEVLAYHYRNADHPEKAFEFLVRAGEKALELSSVEMARSHLTEALDISANKLTPSESTRAWEEKLRARLYELAAC